MNKPIKPNITIPQSFAENGVKTDFDDTLLTDGFDDLRPDVLAGDNLNKLIDDTYKGLNYSMAASDAINLINEGETLTVVDGKLTSGASGGGLEIGDIGIAPLGIDETKGKRRYLNGQTIIQEQYVQFTNKVKSAVVLYPTLACTEEEWQTTATMTVGGQVGKFVVDDDAGTIRLPKIIMPIQGLTDLSKLAEIVEAGSPNITGSVGINKTDANPQWSPESGVGALNKRASTGTTTAGGTTQVNGVVVTFDASLSNPIYSNSDTVQQEQIQYPYFIQVATGSETEDNIINTLELNNPFVLLEPKYFESEVYNVSWLLANGSYNGSNAVHPSAYQALLAENNAEVAIGSTVTLPIGTEYTKRGLSVKLSTDSDITDYDFVVNTSDETFRLPLLDGSESLPSDKWETLTAGASLSEYTAPANGWYTLASTNNPTTGWVLLKNLTSGMTVQSSHNTISNASVCIEVRRGDVVQISYYQTTPSFRFNYAQGNGSLYFYVGETVQNANLINAGRIEEKITEALAKPHIIATYRNGYSWYRVWSDGWCEQGSRVLSGAWQDTTQLLMAYKDTNYNIICTIARNGWGAGTDAYNYFISAEPSNNGSFLWATVGHAGTQAFRPFQWYACGYIE